MGADGALVVSHYIHDNMALTKLIFGGDRYKENSWDNNWITPELAALEVGMKEADLSNKHLGVAGAIIAGAWISHKDNGALTSLNMSDNSLGGYFEEDEFIGEDDWISDMTGIKALAAAIPECR